MTHEDVLTEHDKNTADNPLVESFYMTDNGIIMRTLDGEHITHAITGLGKKATQEQIEADRANKNERCHRMNERIAANRTSPYYAVVGETRRNPGHYRAVLKILNLGVEHVHDMKYSSEELCTLRLQEMIKLINADTYAWKELAKDFDIRDSVTIQTKYDEWRIEAMLDLRMRLEIENPPEYTPEPGSYDVWARW